RRADRDPRRSAGIAQWRDGPRLQRPDIAAAIMWPSFACPPPRLMSKIVHAVTAVITCGDELLMVYRQPFLAAFAGFHAFPGGKVDAADAAGADLPGFCAAFEPRLMRALLPETQEELQVDLAALPSPPRVRHLGL